MFTPTHPGEVLRDEIECRGLDGNTLSEQTGLPYESIREMLDEKSAVTVREAMLIEAALGLPAASLLRLQMKYDMQTAAQDKAFASKLRLVRQCAAML